MGDRKPGAANVHTDKDQVNEIERVAERLAVRCKLLEPELSISGLKPLDQRPQLLHAVEGVEAGRYCGIIVAYVSRLGRNTRAQLEVWDRVEAAGGKIVTARDNLDTSTPQGRMFRTIMLANAQREAEEHAERFEELREWATAAGIWQRRQTPRGYHRHSDTRRLVRNQDAPAVEQAFRDRLADVPISTLARRLGMTPGGVRALLRNRVYLGELTVGQHVNPNAHPPISDADDWPDVFADVQAMRTTRPARSTTPTLLAGLVRCRSCGHVMRRGTSGNGHPTYSCHGQHSAGRCPAPTAVVMQRLETHVIPIALAELATLRARAAGISREIAAARKAVADARAELAAYLEGVRAAGIDPADWAAGARARREALDTAEAHLQTLLDRQPATATGDPLEAWERMDTAQRNRLLRRLMDCLIVRPAGRGRRVPIDQRVRVIAYDTGVVKPYRGGGVALPISELPFPGLDDPIVLRP